MFYINWPPFFYYLFVGVDILVVATFIYYLISFISPKSLIRTLITLGIFALLLALSQLFKLQLVLWITQKFLFVFPFGVLVLFQQEIKKFLIHNFGQQYFQRFFLKGKISGMHYQRIFKALEILSHAKIGAIIIFSRTSSLEFFKRNAVYLEAEISTELLVSIFTPTTPLHDGAVIIEENKIAVAGAFVPITERNTAMHLGSRHRAAIGITEGTDAIALTVSEETGAVSFCIKGEIDYNLSLKELSQRLTRTMGGDYEPVV